MFKSLRLSARCAATVVATAAFSCSLPDAIAVQIVVDSSQGVHAISPYVYGTNRSQSDLPFARSGGNRWTAYNWENNASNAGSDYMHQNDGYLSNSNTPGQAVRPAIQWAAAHDQAYLLTVPIAGYVAADKNGGGDVNQTPNYLQSRFKQSLPSKGAPFTLNPSTSDAYVYQDEFVNWVEQSARANPQQQIFYGLDNEPDLWAETHPRIHPNRVGYAELAQRTIDYADAIKDVNPNAVVFGAVNYGWSGYRTLQDAPDRAGRDFHEFFLAQMQAAETTHGHRLLDVLDIHWYPEAQGAGVRITGSDASPAVAAARMQAPRSLWDPTYNETSWITQWSTFGPIRLLDRVQEDIDQFYPGTKIAITEYNYGAGNHISGGVAQADALGVFGREGLFAANWWDLGVGSSYVDAAFNIYRNFDGAGGQFADLSVQAGTSDSAATSVYASVDSQDRNRMTLVLINRTGAAVDADIAIDHDRWLTFGEAFEFNAASSAIIARGDVALAEANALDYLLPAYSVTLIELRALAGDLNGDAAVDIFDVAVASAHWGEAGPTGDANGDGAVDIFDVALISANWGAAPATNVPEPGTIWLSLGTIVCLGGAVRCKRRG